MGALYVALSLTYKHAHLEKYSNREEEAQVSATSDTLISPLDIQHILASVSKPILNGLQCWSSDIHFAVYILCYINKRQQKRNEHELENMIRVRVFFHLF